VEPPVVFDANDLTKRFVFSELSVNTFKIYLVSLKNFKESVNSYLFPPLIFLQDEEATTQDVADITATTNIRR